MLPPPLPHQSQVLETVLGEISDIAADSGTPLVVFDLDATLFDTRPRTLRILGEYGRQVQESRPRMSSALLEAVPDDVQYLLSDTLRELGLGQPETIREITAFWQERYYSDAYLRWDHPISGAVAYVQACHEAGATVVYLSGRDTSGMLLGTMSSLRECEFPVATLGCQLALKPDANLSDEAFKRGALPMLANMGHVVAIFDNEPANCNLASAIFPDAVVVMLETQRVPFAPSPVETIESVSDFRMIEAGSS